MPYYVIPLLSCIFSSILMMAILARDPFHRVNQRGALLVGGAVWWAACEVLWNTSDNPDTVLWLVRASSIGWVAIGPLGLEMLLEVSGRTATTLRRLMPALYGLAVFFISIDLTTQWFHTGVVRTSWGWGYTFGPVYPAFYLYTVGCLGTGLYYAYTALRSSPSPAERHQTGWVMAGICVPMVVASLTDGILPALGYQPPRLGTASVVFLGATIVWGFYRYGYSMLVPGLFSRQIVETLPAGVALLRLDGRIRSANGGFARLTGVPAFRLEGRRIQSLLDGDELDWDGEMRDAECELETSGGRRLPVAVSSSPLYDKQHLHLGTVLVVRDLREVVALRRRLVTSGRLAAVGELAAGIAHEINNPIAFVHANLGMLRENWNELSEKHAASSDDKTRTLISDGNELIDESMEGIDRIAAIVRDIKGFAHSGSARHEMVNLNEVIESVLHVASPQLRYGIEIERRYQEISRIAADSQKLKQVFLNLVVNAAQALGEAGGTIRLVTREDTSGVLACIEDDGCGIEPELVERIFDPFFTTKPVGEGTGLGLPISHEIVRQHGGVITVDSEPGQGTAVCVRLPLGELTTPEHPEEEAERG